MDAGDVLDLKPLHRQGDCTHYSDVLGLLTHRQPCQSNSNGSPDKKQPSQGKSCPIWEKEKKKTTCLRLEKAGIQFPCLKSCSYIPPDSWLLLLPLSKPENLPKRDISFLRLVSLHYFCSHHRCSPFNIYFLFPDLLFSLTRQ